MTKGEFLASLRSRLTSLPQSAIDRSLAYYAEMLDDRIEDGMAEQDAVASMESVDVIAERIILETPLPTLLRERMRPKGGMTALTVTLLVLGSPVWLPLLLSIVAVVVAVFVSVWSVVASLFAVVVGLGVGGLIALVLSPLNFSAGTATGLMVIALGLVSVGLSILAFFAAAAAAVGLIKLTVMISRGLRGLFVPSAVAERGARS